MSRRVQGDSEGDVERGRHRHPRARKANPKQQRTTRKRTHLLTSSFQCFPGVSSASEYVGGRRFFAARLADRYPQRDASDPLLGPGS
jgi:hypothetical protein